MSISHDHVEDGWNTYRRLVVDTLQRLDERTDDLYHAYVAISSQMMRAEQSISNLETSAATNAEKISAIDNSVKKIQAERIAEKTRSKTLLYLGGGLWTLITIGVTALIRIAFG